jgi:hypothetical protein
VWGGQGPYKHGGAADDGDNGSSDSCGVSDDNDDDDDDDGVESTELIRMKTNLLYSLWPTENSHKTPGTQAAILAVWFHLNATVGSSAPADKWCNVCILRDCLQC